MRIEPTDVAGGLLVDVVWLTDGVLRFRLGGERSVPPYLAALLEGRTAETIMPQMPNRGGIAHNFETVRRSYADALMGWRSGPPATRDVTSVAELARRTLAHTIAPLAAYGNGQIAMTLVELGPGRYELARHPHPHDLFEFCSDLGVSPPLDPFALRWFASIEAAETAVLRELGVVSQQALALADATSGAPVDGQVWAQRVGTPVRVLVRHARGVARWQPYTRTDAREFLRALDLGGRCVRSCATCRYFHFSGMSHDMSGGEAGYCGHRGGSDGLGTVSSADVYSDHAMVSAFDLCPAWALAEDAG